VKAKAEYQDKTPDMNDPACGLPGEKCATKRIIVVGAGLAGLTAALKLSDTGAKIDILEASSVPGGNAWFENYDELRLPTAGSCFRSPSSTGEIAALLTQIGLQGKWRSTGASMQILFRTGALMAHLHEVSLAFLRHPSWLLKPKVWNLSASLVAAAVMGRPLVTAPKALGTPIFADFYQFLGRLVPDGGGYPAVPWTAECGISRAQMEMLDRMTIGAFLFDPKATSKLPEPLRPPKNLGGLVRLAVETTLQVEGLLLDTCSAYVGLHFLVGYLFGDLVALPGGNGAVSNAMINHLKKRPGIALRTQCTVNTIRVDETGCDVNFLENGQSSTQRCDGVVIATPKWIAQSLLPDLPAAQKAAMSEIQYSDYAIVNARLKEAVWPGNFGGYFIGDRPASGAAAGFCQAGGVVNASWSADPNNRQIGGLTFLKPVARPEDQGKLSRTQTTILKAEAEAEVKRSLKAMGADPAVLDEISLHLWPNGLVSPRPGQLASDLFNRAGEPFQTAVFANQDSSGVGSLESAIEAGARAARALGERLAASPPALAPSAPAPSALATQRH
jgi:2-methyl-3-n-amyl-dihydropyrrolel dehydrogenase